VRNANDPELCKIYFELEASAWHGSTSESVWARVLGDNTYEVKNTPFYVKGVSFHDCIEAYPRASGSELWFSKLLRSSGHSTYRILIRRSDDLVFKNLWQKLECLGCTYEGSGLLNLPLWAIDVPPEANISLVYSILEEGEASGVWSFDEGKYASKAT